MKGKLYLIPSPLGDNDPREVIPASVLERIHHIRHFVAEEIRTVRRYLSRAGLKGQIEQLTFYELNEHTPALEIEGLLAPLLSGEDVGLISEAGLPAVADPGADLVWLAQQQGIEVIPMVGPSSLMLALMGSGLNGQRFAFHGYLPAKKEERRKALAELERESIRLHQTQLFIETPYRNEALLDDLLAGLHPRTRLCLAADLTLPTAYLKTNTVAGWKKARPVLGKRPCVFLFLA